jgi:hypothetical protein
MRPRWLVVGVVFFREKKEANVVVVSVVVAPVVSALGRSKGH